MTVEALLRSYTKGSAPHIKMLITRHYEGKAYRAKYFDIESCLFDHQLKTVKNWHIEADNGFCVCIEV